MTDRTKSYKPSRMLTNFHIRGFQYWDGALVLNELNVGDRLQLVAESDNPHDSEAIAVYYEDTKLGYIPSDENHVLFTLFFYGHSDIIEAYVMQVNAEEDPWNQVRMGIYVKDAQ